MFKPSEQSDAVFYLFKITAFLKRRKLLTGRKVHLVRCIYKVRKPMILFKLIDNFDGSGCTFRSCRLNLCKSLPMCSESNRNHSHGTAFRAEGKKVIQCLLQHIPVIVAGTKHNLTVECKSFFVQTRKP